MVIENKVNPIDPIASNGILVLEDRLEKLSERT